MRNNLRLYKEIQKQEFEAFLDYICHFAEFDEEHYKFDFIEYEPGNWRRISGNIINEFCYYVAIGTDERYCLKIYSSIRRNNNISRGVGEDAIRVVVADAATGKPARGAFPKIKRIKKWRKNLHRRMSHAIGSMDVNIICPLCQKMLLFRRNKTKDSVFLGCSAYPSCKGSRNF